MEDGEVPIALCVEFGSVAVERFRGWGCLDATVSAG